VKRKSWSLFFFFFLVSMVIQTSAQQSLEREKFILEKNVQLYQQGKYSQAEQNFSLLVSKLPDSPLLTTNYLMLVKSKYKLGDYINTIEQCKKFLMEFPNSSYRDDILFAMGNSYYQLNRFTTAARTWLNSLEICDDQRMVRKLETFITGTIKYKLRNEEIVNLVTDMSTSEDGQMLATLAWAKKEFEGGSSLLARSKLEESIKNFPDSRYTDQAMELLASGGNPASMDERFALLLPLSGFNEDLGKSILEGVQLALDEYNAQYDLDLKITVRDYGQEITTAIKSFKDLAQNQNLLAIIGPLENDMTAACAALSGYEHLPVLSPTATENKLTEFSDYFFQLNSPINISAESIARYALDSLKLKRFVTFAPIEDHFIKMVNTFTETVQKSGAEMLAQEWYYPGDQDVFKQFMKLKRVGLKLAFSDSVLQKTPNITPVELDSLYKVYLSMEREKLEETKAKMDSADILIEVIECVFIPIFKEDLKFIAPQIAYSNIQAQYLGNGDWYNLEELKKNKNYINGIIFGTDGYLNEESWDYRRFRNEYRNKFKKSPSIYSILGYDSFKYAIQAFDPKTKNMSRNQYFQNLKSLNKYNGIYRVIDLNKKRYNKGFQLLKYNYGQIIPLN
jgi:ABC-type branched-subunit amino acid transport system substrate-binding protein/outer membrane protein assembly factor BamD (BamD/ComL family)